MKITNIDGTTQNTCSCGSWLDHWKKFSGQSIMYCPVEFCLEKDLVGAHVQKVSLTDHKWYIIPLCQRHNAEKAKSLTVSDSYRLVSANISETCGKK